MWLKGIVAAVFGYGFTDIPKKKYDICRQKITGLENVSHMLQSLSKLCHLLRYMYYMSVRHMSL